MAIFDLFSKRQKKLRGEFPDVYVYEEIPIKLRVQIIHIIGDAIGRDYQFDLARKAANYIHKTLCREYGVFTLNEYASSDLKAVSNYFLTVKDYEVVLDIIELSFVTINTRCRKTNYRDLVRTRIHPDDAIAELNARFKEHGVGYQFESGLLIRIDSKFLHAEVIKPVLQMLKKDKIYKGANEEFLKAHEHYRHERYKECLNECLKSFESLMKAICNKQRWAFAQKDTAKKLINICLQKKLIPEFMQTQFLSFNLLLESGIPTLRNRLGGHGQGIENIKVGSSIASYAMHLTATNLLFLSKLETELK